MTVGGPARLAAVPRRRRIWWGYLALYAAGSALYYALLVAAPASWDNLVYHGVAVSSAVAVLAGIRLHRPEHPGPWALLAVSLAITTTAELVADALTGAGLAVTSDLLFLIAYLIGGVGLGLLVRRHSPRRDAASLLDALIVAAALGLFLGASLVTAYLASPSLSAEQKIGMLASPVLDAVLVTVAVWLTSDSDQRIGSFNLLVAGFAVVLVADTAYALLVLEPGGGRWAEELDLVWLAGFALMGASALHPSMRLVNERTVPPVARLTGDRIAVLLGVALLAPTLVAVRAALHDPVSIRLLAGGMVVLFALVFARMNALAGAEQARVDVQERLLDRIVAATEEERMRVAADLHDGPIQRLAGVSYSAAVIRRRLERGDPGAAVELLEDLERRVGMEVAALRRVMVELRPPVLDERGLEEALVQLVAGFGRRTGIHCSIEVALDLRLDPSRETVLYRVAQEVLTNVAKHAGASSVRASLAAQDRTARLEIRDDGVGFDPDLVWGALDPQHLGLVIMRQRVEMAGGAFEARSGAGRGTAVTVHLPLRPASDDTRMGRRA